MLGYRQCQRSKRILTSSATKTRNRSTIKIPNTATKTSSWERGAKLVKNTQTTNEYLEHIRDVHDPSLHLKTIEDELLGTMGKALGKQGEKILRSIQSMTLEREKYNALMIENHMIKSKIDNGNHVDFKGFTSLPKSVQKEARDIANQHNQYRIDAVNARWELLVHRQAVGFITNNNKFVHEKFPIADAILIPGSENDDADNDHVANKSSPQSTLKQKAAKKTFGDQLDWWQRIGRWR